MSAAVRQRGATRAQLAHRSGLLLSTVKCIACGRPLSEHTPIELLDCHRRKPRAVWPLAALVLTASVARG